MNPGTSYFISNSLKKIMPKSVKTYLSFLGNLPFPVILCDKDNNIRFFNQELLEISSFTVNELIDASVLKIFYKVNNKEPVAEVRNNLKFRKTRTFEQKLAGKKGQSVDVTITIRHLELIESIRLNELFFQKFNSRFNEPEIAGIQKKFSEIQTYGNLGYWVLNNDRTQFNGSEECLKLLGFNPITGFVRFIDLISSLPRKEDRTNIERGLIGIANTEQAFQTEIKIKKGQNANSENRILSFFSKWSDEIPGGIYKGIIHDITQAKKIEKEFLKAREKAERADRLKSHFLTNLSYEIRTPMNAILGFAELLNLEDLSNEQKLEYTRIIRMKGNNLLSIIDDGIELSKFETGNISINKTEFELYPLLKELFDEFDTKRIQFGKNNITLELKVPDVQFHEKIFTDQGRLQQLLSNLLSNAIQFTEKGEIEFGYKKSGKFFKFYVRDTGIGINKEDQNLIFNRFYEFEETPSKKYAGSGLNLTISKHIVELLGGKIKVKSELNKGSRFQISLPVESSKSKKTDMTEFDDLNAIIWKDRVILIAEDEDMNYRFLEAVLQKTQTQILRAKTGREAVELCKNISKIDLVLMDIKMPEMNGFDATREIKKLRPSLPVIAQTAYAAQDELIKCQQSGCDDIITKPIDINLLLKKITDLIH